MHVRCLVENPPTLGVQLEEQDEGAEVYLPPVPPPPWPRPRRPLPLEPNFLLFAFFDLYVFEYVLGGNESDFIKSTMFHYQPFFWEAAIAKRPSLDRWGASPPTPPFPVGRLRGLRPPAH